MGKHARKHNRKTNFDPYEDFDDDVVDDLDGDELARDVFSNDWEGFDERDSWFLH